MYDGSNGVSSNDEETSKQHRPAGDQGSSDAQNKVRTLYDLTCWFKICNEIVKTLPEAMRNRARVALEKIWRADTSEDFQMEVKTFSDQLAHRHPGVVERLKSYQHPSRNSPANKERVSYEISSDALDILKLFFISASIPYPPYPDRYRGDINALYHFTSIRNLSGIRHLNGLCSKQTLEENNCWPVPQSGGDAISHALDKRNGNWDKIALNFTPHTPMSHHGKKRHVQGGRICFFALVPDVICLTGVEFSNTNAAATRRTQMPGLEGLKSINFKMIRSEHEERHMWRNWKRDVQAEVLVPDRVSLKFVREIIFDTDDDLAQAKQEWGNRGDPRFRVAPCLFTDGPYYCNSECQQYYESCT